MSKIRMFAGAAVVVIAATAAAAVPATDAAAPAIHDKINLTVPGVDLCGFTGTLRVAGVQVVTFTDAGVKVVGQVKNTFTTDTGRAVTISQAGQFVSAVTQTADTLTFVDTYKGLPEKISSPGHNVLTRDAGVISFITTIDILTGNVTDTVVVHGPHPEADSQGAVFCAAVTNALS